MSVGKRRRCALPKPSNRRVALLVSPLSSLAGEGPGVGSTKQCYPPGLFPTPHREEKVRGWGYLKTPDS